MTPAQDMDAQFAELRDLVRVSWSNLDLEPRVNDLYCFVPPGSIRCRSFFASALRAAKNSGSHLNIITRLDNLQAAIKDHHALRARPAADAVYSARAR